ncbi:hypothetical protein K3495_g16263 [Podosphaera aphanis]|nr:hypothetical protein K3495_g16263 [Podosphaera aphanis]
MRHFRGELRSVTKPFTVLSDHRNLQYFMTTRQLSERQVRWAEELTGFDFEIKYRPGADSAKPDLLSRKAELKPKDPGDDRLKKREIQLLKDRWLSPRAKLSMINYLGLSAVATRRQTAQTKTKDQQLQITTALQTPPKGKKLFDEPKIQALWDQVMPKDPNFFNIYTSVMRGDRSLPTTPPNSIQMPDCSLDSQHALIYRGALWVPEWEPLRTALLQKVHDSHVTGHPGVRIYVYPCQYDAK